MLRTYIRKTETVYSEKDLQEAVSAVRDDHLSLNAADERFKIPRTTLYGRLSGRQGDGGRDAKPILSQDEEKFELLGVLRPISSIKAFVCSTRGVQGTGFQGHVTIAPHQDGSKSLYSLTGYQNNLFRLL